VSPETEILIAYHESMVEKAERAQRFVRAMGNEAFAQDIGTHIASHREEIRMIWAGEQAMSRWLNEQPKEEP
jgi:hypothetical protein